jgi:hypothetical protein
MLPHDLELVQSRAAQAGLTASRYLQVLAEFDRKMNILPLAIMVNLARIGPS